MSTTPTCACLPSRADERRARLIATARRLFVEHGFHATGIAQIARESGIAVGQIYRDFASKDEIVAGLVTGDCGRFMRAEELYAAIRNEDRVAVRLWLLDFVEPDDDRDGNRLFAEVVAESARNDRIAAIFTGLQDQVHANLIAALVLLVPADAAAEGRAVLADAIMTMSLGMLHHALMRPGLDTGALVRTFHAIIDARVAALEAAFP